MTAPAPSATEAAVIDRFGIFDEERIVEEVAEALAACHLSGKPYKPQPAGPPRVDWSEFAAAAVAAYRATQDGGAEAAVRRVEAIADGWISDAQRQGEATDLHFAGVMIRAALAPQDGDGAR